MTLEELQLLLGKQMEPNSLGVNPVVWAQMNRRPATEPVNATPAEEPLVGTQPVATPYNKDWMKIDTTDEVKRARAKQLKDQATDRATAHEQTSSQLAKPVGELDWSIMQSRIRDMPGISEARKGIEASTADIERLRNEPRAIDWSALVPAASGFMKRLSPGAPDIQYQRPLSDEERQMKIRGLEDAIQKQRIGLADKEVDAIRAQLTDRLMEKYYRGTDTGTNRTTTTTDTDTTTNRTGRETGTERGTKVGTGKALSDTDWKEVKELQKRMQELAPIESSLRNIDQVIGGIDKYKGQDLPGSGLTGWLPQSAMSAKGVKTSEAINDLRNQITLAQSGKAVTDSEAKRLNSALGSGTFSGDAAMVEGIKRFKETFADIVKEREAAYLGLRPNVVREYRKGGGLNSEKIRAIGQGGDAKKEAIQSRLDKIDALLERELGKGQ